ncbi:MAG TPA: ABC transporter ATP-binding protein/permease [Mycobacteriales bacterium]|nr:ABC transporter ATP-binding protein/permease [Mycobacteriales bacterium]
MRTLEPDTPAPHAPAPQTAGAGAAPHPDRALDWRRLRHPAVVSALVAALLAAVGETLGTVVAGRLAESPSGSLIAWLALCLVGGAALDTAGRTAWAAVVDRAEGRLRADLLSAALAQPLPVLTETAVGEVLDRVDDDTHELGVLLRRMVWDLGRTLLRALPMWVVAGLAWWPAWFLFPLVGVATWLAARPLAGEIRERKVAEEMAWTDHAAAMEEGVAARDDLRSSLGQAYLVRRCAELSAAVQRRVAATCQAATTMTRRAGLILHALLAVCAVGGIVLVDAGRMSTASLVTLFLVTSAFVGQVYQTIRHVPDLQQGLGALARLRQLLSVEPEPTGGRPLPSGPIEIVVEGLRFSYPQGSFALRGVSMVVPAGTTTALVGRTGSGKSTLAALLSRAMEPPVGTVRLGGVDVRDLDLQALRAAVGVVTQRTEILAATLAENVTLFAEIPRARVEEAVETLGLTDWVAALPGGLDTPLGPGGVALSAGEEQLVAFARLLVRDVQVVVLDEATARMDPLTEARVVRAAEALLDRRTGVVVAHRLSTTARADRVVVLEGGRVAQQGSRSELAREPGPFRELLEATALEHMDVLADGPDDEVTALGSARRTVAPPEVAEPGTGPGLARGTAHVLRIHPWWGLGGAGLFFVSSLLGAFGVVTGLVWGRLVVDLESGGASLGLTIVLATSLMASPLLLSVATRYYPQWWVGVMLRVRLAVLLGQTDQERLPRTPPGEVVARAMDADRLARYGDRWVDFANGLLIAGAAALAARNPLAGAVLLAVMVGSALASAMGSPLAGRSAAASSTARARFGRALVSALDSARTVKLAAATPGVHQHLREVDGGRIDAAVHEHRVQAVLDGLPVVLVKAGVVVGWLVLLQGGWDLATTLLVTTAVNGFDWFGRVAGAVVTEAPGVRRWQEATCQLAGGADLMAMPPGVDLVHGRAPLPRVVESTPLQSLTLRGFAAVHDDGTVGVEGVDLEVRAGDIVLLVGQVGAGKSSLLGALAGLVHHDGALLWNDSEVHSPQLFLRPGQVAYVSQVPRVLSGTWLDNVRLDHERAVDLAFDDARLRRDVDDAGGVESVVGHRGVRLSGGQVQRLALARALATGAELLLADDVSSAVDARTEVELWRSLRRRGTTVVGATSKRAALRLADRVVVLVDGRVVATGPWRDLEPDWGHLAG